MIDISNQIRFKELWEYLLNTELKKRQTMVALNIPPKFASELIQLSKKPISEFEKLAKAVSTAKQPSIRASELFDFLAAKSDREYAAVLIKQLLSLSKFRRSKGKDSSAVVSGLIEGIRKSSIEDSVEEWFVSVRNVLEVFLDSDWVRLTAKTMSLSIDYEQIFIDSDIVTDIRPVFDGARDQVVGGIVTQQLKIRYLSSINGENSCELSLALDQEDIDALIEELQKASKKAVSAQKFLLKSGLPSSFVAGEEDYDFS